MSHIRTLFAVLSLFVAAAVAPAFAAAATEPVDINQASIEQLESLDGIGAAKARAIVEFRDANGPFATVDDLRNVSGIGDKLLASLRPQVTVGAAGGAKPESR
jgi:competence protein ComEA